MVKEMIQKVVSGEDLTEEEMILAMEEIMEGKATDAQIGAFITALRMKGETIEEITGAARVMRRKATPIALRKETRSIDEVLNYDSETILDTCGTGGDRSNTFNVSTATAFVVAGGGVTVAKHGNRSVSSLCGSADVLAELGVDLEVAPNVVEKSLRKIGIAFLYAPMLHSAMRYAIGPRREIGIQSIFNILGPLTNPAGANVQLLGVYDPGLTEVLAETLNRLGSKNAFVVYGEGGFDEISIVGPTRVSELREGKVRTYEVEPEDFGLPRASASDIRGGDPAENAAIIKEILAGAKGPKRDMVLLNAAAAFRAADKVLDIKAGIEMAAESIDSGNALEKLELLVRETRKARMKHA